jgi:hypothetical protein
VADDGAGQGERAPPPLVRLCLDLNVWCASLISSRRGKRTGSSQALVGMVRRGECPTGAVQLVISWGMLNRLRDVYVGALAINPVDAGTLIRGIAALAKQGPAGDAPYLVLGGTGVMPVRDEEDAHVLEIAVAGRAHVVATANLDDFTTYRTEALIEDRVFVHQTGDGRSIVIAHPDDVADWLRRGVFPDAETLRTHLAAGRRR